MFLHINPRSAEPIYLQIIRGVKSAAAKGVLQAGEKLPSVRELATDLAVNHNTVAKAYQELERDKVIEVIRGRGTFISLGSPRPGNLEERLVHMKASLRTWLIEAHHLGISAEEFVEMVREVVREWTLNGEEPRHE